MISENLRFPYWCHACQRETFPVSNLSGESCCNICRQTCIEDIESYREDHPRNTFTDTMANQSQTRRSQSTGRAGRITNFIIFSSSRAVDNPILRIIFSNYGQFQSFFQMHSNDQQFENLLNYIMQNDPNIHGSPPASEKSIKQLKKEQLNESNMKDYENSKECSVCMETYKIEESVVTIPCLHLFHEDCILPWLNIHNSCPICRLELPTDDIEYESKKATIRQEINSNSNSNNSDNFVRRRNNSHNNKKNRNNQSH